MTYARTHELLYCRLSSALLKKQGNSAHSFVTTVTHLRWPCALLEWGPSGSSELRASPGFFPRSLGTRPFAAWATRGSLGTRPQQEEATRSSLGTRPADFWSLGLKFSLGFLRRPSSARCSIKNAGSRYPLSFFRDYRSYSKHLWLLT